MAWLFLLVSLVGAWCTYNVYRPRYAPPRVAVVSFFAGWLTHAFEIFPSPRALLVIEGVERFLASLYSRHLQAQSPAAAEPPALSAAG